MGNVRDNFSPRTRQVLANRVGGRCSNPDCDKPTTAPHSDPDKVRNIGKASHIHAAAEGGPRFDDKQSKEERTSARNGLWLCSDCATDVDVDELRFPASLLKQWKALAESAAELRFEVGSKGAVIASFASVTRELLSWPQTLADGTWIDRPELEELKKAVEESSEAPTILLGPPGSGKSALLSRLGHQLSDAGWTVVAIRADRLPPGIATQLDLSKHIGIDIALARALDAVARRQRVVLLIDQLDALSDLLDLHTRRLDALLTLISESTGLDNVRVVCSARAFDYAHDTRFRAFKATTVELAALPMADVDRIVASIGGDPTRLSPKLKGLLQAPHWLNQWLRLGATRDRTQLTSSQALLEAVWAKNVLSPAQDAMANEDALAELAHLISASEELWISRARLVAHEPALQRLLAAGICSIATHGLQVGFSHQSLFEFARARSFVRKENLVSYTLEHQDSLFVRPTVWTALNFLRATEPKRYQADLDAL